MTPEREASLVAERPGNRSDAALGPRSQMSLTSDPSVDEFATEIVMIEDEPGIGDFVKRGLGARGFRVNCAFDGDSGLECALGERVALVLLDLMLPGRPGLEVLGELVARRPGLPVVVLTARGQLEDRVEGLNAGAADYLVKPFMLAELEARIRAQLRSARHPPVTEIRAAGLEINLLTRRVLSAGRPVRLSNTEFELLLFLMRNPGRTLSRERILRVVWGYTHDPDTNIVDVYIGYLRRKLRTDEQQAPIKTIRSPGYRFDTGG
jgi:DNA-binding response OmpR family regulator